MVCQRGESNVAFLFKVAFWSKAAHFKEKQSFSLESSSCISRLSDREARKIEQQSLAHGVNARATPGWPPSLFISLVRQVLEYAGPVWETACELKDSSFRLQDQAYVQAVAQSQTRPFLGSEIANVWRLDAGDTNRCFSGSYSLTWQGPPSLPSKLPPPVSD